jgi:hypothetical protein
LATKPGVSLARIGVLPIATATAVVAASASSDERSAATTSTSFINTGGLKKCMPTTRSGWGTPAAISPIRSEEVLLARIASGPQATAASENSRCFSPMSSGAASISSSQPASSPIASAGPIRFEAASASSSLQRPRTEPLASASRIFTAALSAASGKAS